MQFQAKPVVMSCMKTYLIGPICVTVDHEIGNSSEVARTFVLCRNVSDISTFIDPSTPASIPEVNYRSEFFNNSKNRMRRGLISPSFFTAPGIDIVGYHNKAIDDFLCCNTSKLRKNVLIIELIHQSDIFSAIVKFEGSSLSLRRTSKDKGTLSI